MILIVKRLIRFAQNRLINLNKKVKIPFRSSVSSTFFEGSNRIGKHTILSDCNVGYGTYMGQNNKLVCVDIGRYCSIGGNIKIINGNHPTRDYVSTHPAFFSVAKQAGFTFVDEQRFEEKKYIKGSNKRACIIGNDVQIGDNVTILAGVKIGNGAIIGTNSLITKDVPDYSITAGVPAREIRKRFNDEDIAYLNRIKWWDKDPKWLRENARYFDNIEKLKDVIKC